MRIKCHHHIRALWEKGNRGFLALALVWLWIMCIDWLDQMDVGGHVLTNPYNQFIFINKYLAIKQ